MLGRFLELFAPLDGGRAVCLAPAGQEPRRAAMCRSAAEIATMIQRARDGNQNAWVSLACFPGTSRSAKQAVDLRMVGVDIDFKPGDIPTFTDKEQALEYTAKTAALGLPFPTFTIDSGHGIHLWYVLDEALPRERWIEVASALWAALGSLHTGFITDPSRKSDAAGLLRLPCTTNTKRNKETKELMPPVPTGFVGGEWAHLSTGQTIDLELLAPVLRRFGAITKSLPPPPPDSKKFEPLVHRSPLELDLSVPDMVAVVRSCKVLQHAYQHQDTAGYGEWWPVIAACSWAGNGREVAHAMSAAHPNYQHEMVDKKFDDFADGDSLPPSCAYLATAVMGDNSACLDCACHMTGRKWPHQHPDLMRGVRSETKFSPEADKDSVSPAPITVPEQVPEPEQETRQASVPASVTDSGSRFYATSDMRMVMKSKNEEGEPIILQLADHAIWGQRFVWNPIDQRTEIVFGTARYDRNHKLVMGEVQVAARYISGEWSAMAAPFADAGVALAAVMPKTKNAFKEYLIFEQSRVRDESRVIEVAHHGWQEDKSFAAGNLVFAPDGASRPARLTASAKAHEQRFARHGSLDEQKALLKLYDAHGSDLSKFIIGLSAGSPAHGLRDRGGTITALVGRSAIGKTKMTEFAASFWGRPDMLLIRPDSTIKSMFEMIGTARNLPSWMDEVTYADRHDLVRSVHQIAAGGGRGALNRNGQARAVEAVPAWASAVVWTSNASIVRQLRGVSDANRAVALRVFELQVREATLALDDTTRLAQIDKAYVKNCGHIGALLAERYATGREALEAAHDDVLEQVAALFPGGASGPHRYHAQILQTFETGAAALHDMGLADMDQATRKRIAEAMARNAMAEAAKGEQSATDTVRQYANENIERMIAVDNRTTNAVGGRRTYVPAQAAVGRIEKEDGKVRVRLNRARFEEWLSRRDSTLDAVLAEARSEFILRPDAEESVDIYAGCTRLDRGSGVAEQYIEAPVVTFWLPERVDQVAAAKARRQG